MMLDYNAEIADQLARVYQQPVPTIREFIVEPYYLGKLVTAVETQVSLLEKIFSTETDYNIVALSMGIGWGKTFLVSTALTYMVYRTLCLRDPQAYYGLAPGSVISFINFSVTGTQAKEVLFTHIRNLTDEAPCFQEAGFQREKRIKSALRWRDRNLGIFPGTSEARSGIGYNVLGAAIDEASWFPPPNVKIQRAGQVRTDMDPAQQLGETIIERMKSRGNSRWRRDNMLLAISSPRTVHDWLETFNGNTSPKVFFDRQPTWAGYPSAHLTGKKFRDTVCGEVPIEYHDSFATDPERARRNLGAIPSQNIEQYFSDIISLANVYSDTAPSIFEDDKPTLNLKYLNEKLHKYQMTGVPMWSSNAPRFVHIDLGLIRDHAGIAIAHQENSKIVFDGVTYLSAADFPLNEVEFAAIREMLITLATKYMLPISEVQYDGWQSADSKQLLTRAGFKVVVAGVKLDAYDTTKELIGRGVLVMPRTTRSMKFYEEASELELIGGIKVDHPVKGTKDVADAVVGVCNRLCMALGGIQKVRTLVNTAQHVWDSADSPGGTFRGLSDVNF